jgi:hypothetical protein
VNVADDGSDERSSSQQNGCVLCNFFSIVRKRSLFLAIVCSTQNRRHFYGVYESITDENRLKVSNTHIA